MDSPFTIKPRLMRSPTDFEEAAADWMRVWGYHSVRRTHAGRDGGIDVESVEGVAQVKAWMVPVGSPEIQQLRGAAHDGRAALFFSLTDYTPAALRFADEAGVILFRFSGYTGEVEPVNQCASRFLTECSQATNICIENFSLNPIYQLVKDKLKYLADNPGGVVYFLLKSSNRFVQSGAGDGGVFNVESIGPEYANFTRPELLRLADLGWPTKPRKKDNYRIWYDELSDQQRDDVAAMLAHTLIDVHGATTEDDLEVTLDRFVTRK
jgi:hypothetical protein